MSRVFVNACGVVSPAGWGVEALRRALASGEPMPTRELGRPGWPSGLRVRGVPPPAARRAFAAHARFRRASPIAQYAVAAALDWLIGDAARVFDRQTVVSEGAGALYLRREPQAEPAVELKAVTAPHPFTGGQSRHRAAQRTRAELPPSGPGHLLCDGQQGSPGLDHDEAAAWQDWTGPRLSPKRILGEGFMAAAAWQCAAACDALLQTGCSGAHVSIVGCNQQAIAAQFVKTYG